MDAYITKGIHYQKFTVGKKTPLICFLIFSVLIVSLFLILTQKYKHSFMKIINLITKKHVT